MSTYLFFQFSKMIQCRETEYLNIDRADISDTKMLLGQSYQICKFTFLEVFRIKNKENYVSREKGKKEREKKVNFFIFFR